ncbi:hypothetical protein BH10ACI1_BH10ACI1_06220 [soil metagenome]
MNKKEFPLSRKNDIVVQEHDDEVLIYDLNENKAFCLNKTSAIVWQACDGKRTIAEINDFVGQQLNSKTDEYVIWLALDQLSKENLIENDVKLTDKFVGLSRREVIKKVGLASVIALPLVSSLVAPMAIHANSACVAGGTALAPHLELAVHYVLQLWLVQMQIADVFTPIVVIRKEPVHHRLNM